MKRIVDIQYGCCQLNKKLLNKSLDELKPGEEMDLVAENSDVVRSLAMKYIGAKNCVIGSIEPQDGTCVITVKKNE